MDPKIRPDGGIAHLVAREQSLPAHHQHYGTWLPRSESLLVTSSTTQHPGDRLCTSSQPLCNARSNDGAIRSMQLDSLKRRRTDQNRICHKRIALPRWRPWRSISPGCTVQKRVARIRSGGWATEEQIEFWLYTM
jgi:hypothetical protein